MQLLPSAGKRRARNSVSNALQDESAEAFAELSEVIPGSTITFNGISRPCVSQSLDMKRANVLHGYEGGNAQQVTMLATDYADFDGITDRVSKMSVNGGAELILLQSDVHPNSATIHLFLGSSK